MEIISLLILLPFFIIGAKDAIQNKFLLSPDTSKNDEKFSAEIVGTWRERPPLAGRYPEELVFSAPPDNSVLIHEIGLPEEELAVRDEAFFNGLWRAEGGKIVVSGDRRVFSNEELFSYRFIDEDTIQKSTGEIFERKPLYEKTYEEDSQ